MVATETVAGVRAAVYHGYSVLTARHRYTLWLEYSLEKKKPGDAHTICAWSNNKKVQLA